MTTAKSAFAAVQRAMYERLTGDPELSDLVTGIYDHVPEGTAYPYVVLGEALETPRNRHGEFGRTTVATLHVWSKYNGFREATEIADRVIALLDHQPLSVPGHLHISTVCEYTQTLRDPDPEIRHVPVRFRVTTEQ